MSLAVNGLGMRFGQRWVLEDVSMTFEPGQVHGLIGHNGSGKSTLIKILSGYHAPTAGRVTLDGASLSGAEPAVIRRRGLRFVHQDLGLIPEFTALENMGIGGTYSRRTMRTIDWKQQGRRLQATLELFGSDVPLDVPVGRLSAVQRSLVSIARAIETDIDGGADPRYLVLDEPTTALEGPEVEYLFDVVRALCRSGIGVLYVSHHLRDVLALSSSISVLREGRRVATFTDREATHEALVEAMLGDTLARPESTQSEVLPAAAVKLSPSQPLARGGMTVRGLRSSLLRGVDLDLAAGECVCVMGLSGSGREQLAYALAGAAPSSSESMVIGGAETGGLRPHTCRAHRVALVPGNRMAGSMIADFTVRENMSLVSLERHRGRLRTLSRASERKVVRKWTDRLEIRPSDAEYSTRNLSGGNKQKVILAKWLETDPLVMLIDEPTAGVDIGARARLLAELRTLVAEGRTLLITTSDVDDALVVADRVLIMNGGRVSHELLRDRNEITEKSILASMNHISTSTDVASAAASEG